jgi:hypothetical protein
MRIAEQRSRMTPLRETDASTATAEAFLSVVQQNNELMRTHIAVVAKNDSVRQSSQRDNCFSVPILNGS